MHASVHSASSSEEGSIAPLSPGRKEPQSVREGLRHPALIGSKELGSKSAT